MIVIVDYGMGNLESIRNMLTRLSVPSLISSRAADLETADHLILPGVGAFDHAVDNIHERGLWDVIRTRAREDRVPLLGICLGMQLLADRSEEGVREGLGLIAGEVRRFRFEQGSPLRVPHMGWNHVKPTRTSSLFDDTDEEHRYYFVHSYYFVAQDPDVVIGQTTYCHGFASAIQHGTTFGVQFHPEKSHKFGMRLLRWFSERP
jgi:imidazole glycerol-phosphate synthase subunit HisH